jgi:hypothetical protein
MRWSCMRPRAECRVRPKFEVLFLRLEINCKLLGFCAKFTSVTVMASLEILLDRRNRWEQIITLELFNGVKDIFRNHLPVEVTRKQNFVLSPGAITPVALYEFELRELFVEATVKSGCKWWCRHSECSTASARVSRSLWTTRFVCRHFGKDYEKRAKNNSRNTRHVLRCSCPACCIMKAISVKNHESFWSIRSHTVRLITPTEDTDIWFFVCPLLVLNLENCATLFIGAVLKPGCVCGESTCQTCSVCLNSTMRMKQKQCFAHPYPT